MTEQQPYEVVEHRPGYELRRYPASVVAEVSVDAPVVQTAATSNRHVVAFVLPSSVTLDSAPVPTDPRVAVREVPASLTAVSQYSGRWTQRSYDDHLRILLDALTADGLTPIGEPRFARFDPPFTPWFMRRNEVQIDVANEQP